MTESPTQPSTAAPTVREDTSVALIYQQIKRSPEAIAGLAIMVTVVFAAIAAPILAPFNPYTQDLSQTLLPPSWAHLMGTDNFGRDILSRVIFGSRIDLTIAFSVVAIAGPLGTLVGIFSGFRGGRVDEG